MSRFSNLFAAGIFIVFLAVLFHYFCRVRRKPEMIVQQHVQVPEGYVYPITPSNPHTHQIVLAPNFGHLHPPFVPASYPVNVARGSLPHQHTYNIQNNLTAPAYIPRSQQYSNPARPNQPEDDLPPPYHVAVASSEHVLK